MHKTRVTGIALEGMMKNLLLLGLLLLSLAACGSVEDVAVGDNNLDEYRLGTQVVPVAQQLTLNIDPEKADYSGQTDISLDVKVPTTQFRLHAQDMQIETLRLSHDGEELVVSHESGEHGLLIVTSANEMAAGSYKLSIAFSNDFNTDGAAINRTEQEGRSYVFSQFEAIDARRAFPCFDEPGFKFPWQLTITVPENQMAISNTPEVSVTTADGFTTTVFDVTPPLPSYLIAIAAGPFETVPIDGMSVPGRVVVPYGKTGLAAVAVETTPALLANLEEYFGEPYPFKKLDLIATNQAFSGAMEHPGAITYSDFLLLLDDTASARQKGTLIKITAHELAHQWFGNLVTMQWWDDLWLNESFADWMGDKTVEDVYPEFGRDLSELRTTFRVMDTDARSTTKPIRHDFKANDNFEDGIFLSYYKGKSVIGMFEKAVGADVFREGVVDYIRKFSRGSATAGDFWASIDVGADFDVASGFASFVDQTGIPLVSVKPVGGGYYEFSQSRLVTGTGEYEQEPPWIMPLTFTYLSGDTLQSGSFVLDSESQTIDLGKDVAWIMPNGNQEGYYRWQIPDDMLTRLSQDSQTHLNARERMGLLTNLWALLSTEKINANDYLAALLATSADNNAAVLAAMLDQLGSASETLITAELREPYAAYVRTLLMPTFDRIGAQAIPGEDTAQASLRPRVLGWLADDGEDENIRQINTNLAQRFLAGEIPASNLVNLALRDMARRGDQELFDELRQRFEAADSPGERRRFIRALSVFRNPGVVQHALEYALSGSLQPNDISVVVQGATDWPENNAMVFAWLRQHDAELRKLVPEGLMARLPSAIALCSPKTLPAIIEFYGDPERQVPGIEDVLKRVQARVDECWAFRQRELQSVSSYLESRAGT